MINWYEKAVESIGVYPMSNNGVSRTEYQDGWNACLMAIMSKTCEMSKWYDKLSKHQQDSILRMKDAIDVTTYGGDSVRIGFCVNDIFCYGAESVDITIDDIPIISDLYKTDGFDAIVAYAAVKLKYGCFKDGGNFSERIKKLVNTLKNSLTSVGADTTCSTTGS